MKKVNKGNMYNTLNPRRIERKIPLFKPQPIPLKLYIAMGNILRYFSYNYK